jgi:hypothetical protein
MARSEIARRGLRNAEIVQADALNTGLPKTAFDLVHERLVIINVPNRKALAFHATIHANGGNAYIGRELAGYLRSADIKNIRVRIHVDTVNPGEYRRTHLLSLLEVLHDKVIGTGVLTEKQLSNHREALIAHLKNPETLLIDKLLVQAWGQK